MMRTALITTIGCFILPTFLFGQSVFTSNTSIVYQLDQDLKMVEIYNEDENTTITVDTTQKAVTVKTNQKETSYTIISKTEIMMESGSIFKYEMASMDGSVQRLEINTATKIFLIKPKELKSGELIQKFKTTN